MSDCSDYPTLSDAKGFKTNADTINEVVTSNDDRTSPAIDGQTKITLKGIESEVNNAIENTIGKSYIGAWSQGSTTFTTLNEYSDFNGISYKPKSGVSLPYTAQTSDPTSAPDNVNVEPFSDINTQNAGSILTKKFSTLNDALSSSTVNDGDSLDIAERDAGTGNGNMWDAVPTSTVTPNGDNIVQMISDPSLSLVLRSDFSKSVELSSLTETIGSGERFEKISDALKFYERLSMSYDLGTRSVLLTLKSGFVMDEQIFVRNGRDLSFIWIESIDAEVTIDRSSITIAPTSETYKPIFYGENESKLPVINCLFNYDSSGTADDQSGVWVEASSFASFGGSGAGVKNSPGRGLHVSNCSIAYARGTTWDGSGLGLRVSNNSNCQFRNATANNCGFGASCEGSILGFIGSEFKAATSGSCVTLTSCHTTAIGADISDSTAGLGALIEGGSFFGRDITISGNANDGIRFVEGATGSLYSSTITGNSGDGIECDNATVSARDSDLTGNGLQACNVTGAGTARLRGCTITGTFGVLATRGSTIDLTDVSGAGTVATVTRGSTIAASGYDGTLSETANTITANGIIFQ